MISILMLFITIPSYLWLYHREFSCVLREWWPIFFCKAEEWRNQEAKPRLALFNFFEVGWPSLNCWYSEPFLVGFKSFELPDIDDFSYHSITALSYSTKMGILPSRILNFFSTVNPTGKACGLLYGKMLF